MSGGGWLSKLCSPEAPQFRLGVNALIRPSDVRAFRHAVVDAGKGIFAFDRYRWLLGERDEILVAREDDATVQDVYVLVQESEVEAFVELLARSPQAAAQSRAFGVLFVLATERAPHSFPQHLAAQFQDQRHMTEAA